MESLVDKCSSGLLVASPHHGIMYSKMLCKLDNPKSVDSRASPPHPPPAATPSSTPSLVDRSPSMTPISTLNRSSSSSPSATPSYAYALSVTPSAVAAAASGAGGTVLLSRPSSGSSPKAMTRSPSVTPTLPASSPSVTPNLSLQHLPLHHHHHHHQHHHLQLPSSSPSVTSSSSSSSNSSSNSFTCESPKKQLLPALGLAQEDSIKESVNYDIPGPTNAKVPTPNVCQANMNQMCKVCGEPAAGFHFGAFTCEGCKSFFGRTYNNLSSLNECKNNGRCVINKKTRTSCKSCRLRKCLMVGMSKSGSRYGRRSNWFKIHYLMQNNNNTSSSSASSTSADILTSDSTMTTSNTVTTATITTDTHSPVGLVSPPEISIKSSSPDYKEFKMSSDCSFSADYQFKSGVENKSYHSPPASSETHTSESSLDLSEKSLFPPLSEQLYPKELLSLYNLQNLAPRLPPYVSPNSLAQRYLYPYYPSLLSVYSQKQYLDSLLKEAKNNDDTNALEGDEDDVNHDERSSPDCGIPPPPKFHKSCSRSPPRRSTPEWHSATTEALLRGILPFHHKIPVHDAILAHSSDHNPGYDFLSQEEEDSDLVPEGATAPQDLPIDLSMKSKFSTYSFHKIINLEHSMCRASGMDSEENSEEVSGEKEDERGIQTKNEQEVPLDLSYIGS
ncbi:uncharacterized protein LOC135226357 [Macrobrachium nipponense]|uniref:uncharacterized protein LOC135226357 n=1 Tax=Macrobrachium nipponense TaxID=159736 RepID=UPI0030C859CA